MLRQEDGVALLITLLITVLLVILIIEFDFNTRIELRIAGNFRDEEKAYYLAKSGISAARALLREDKTPQYDFLGEFWSLPLPPYPLGDGYVTVEIIDENRKININNLIGNKSDLTQAQMRRLFRLFEIEEEMIDVIIDSTIDWIDNDGETMIYGAEDDYYNGLEPPYNAKNAKLTTISELRLIKGVNDKIFEMVAPYLTVYTGNTGGKININTAEPIVLQSLHDEITEEMVEKIIEGRPFTTERELETVVGIPEKIVKRLRLDNIYGINSTYFSIRSEGIVNDTKKIISAIVKKGGGIITWRVE